VANIHPLASVDPKAELANDVSVGPFCLVGPDVKIGARTRLLSHVSVTGDTRLGEDNLFFPFCSIGAEPQDISFRGESARTEIGDRNTFRECCQVSRGTAKDKLLTRIGSGNLIMACAHIAHDCVIEDDIIIANNVLLGGHVWVQSQVVFGGAAVVHHYVTVGRLAFIGGMTRVPKDVPPFMLLEGNPAKVWMTNKVGCERRGFSPEAMQQLKDAHRLLYRSDKSWEAGFVELEERENQTPELCELLAFCRCLDSAPNGRALELTRKDRARG
jgi:UDP-N-acetylglucosamine acyltransferase